MRNRNKIGMLLMTGILLLSMVGCTAKESPKEDSQPVKETREEVPDKVPDAVPIEEEKEDTPSLEAETEPVEAEEITQQRPADEKKAIIYSPTEAGDNYAAEAVELTVVEAKELIHLLGENGAVSEDTAVLTFTEEQDGMLVLDLSSDFLDDLTTRGSTGEVISMGCLVNTFLDTYGAKGIKITVDGEAFETGHVEYTGYQKHYGDIAPVS